MCTDLVGLQGEGKGQGNHSCQFQKSGIKVTSSLRKVARLPPPPLSHTHIRLDSAHSHVQIIRKGDSFAKCNIKVFQDDKKPVVSLTTDGVGTNVQMLFKSDNKTLGTTND